MSPNKLARSAQKRFWSVPFTFNPFQFAGSSLTAYTISHTSNEIVPKRLLVSHKTHSDIQQTNSKYRDILLTVHLSTVYFSIFPTRYTILFRLHTVSAILLLLQVSGLTGPSSGGLNCTCSLWYFPPLQMSLSCARSERTFSRAARQRHLQRGRVP